MAPRYCDHEFHVTELAVGELKPATIVCLYCGQIRLVYADGRVVIFKEQGEVKKAYGNPQPNNGIH
jgi:hypothetical protein